MTLFHKLVLSGAIGMPLGLVGCSHNHYHNDDVVVRRERIIVTEAPPRERVEVIGVAPSRDHIWAKGYYVRRGSSWDWAPGHWERLPHERAQWEHAHWEREGGGHVFIEGRWR